MATVPNTGFIVPKRPSLAGAAAGASDPFGLASGRAGLFGVGGNTGSGSAAAQGYSTVGPAQAGQAGSLNVPGSEVKPPTAATVAAVGGGSQNTSAPSAPTLTYDINSDPAYQTAVALVGKSDEQARADASKQIKDYLLAYGDSGLANQLGYGDLAQAAANNPTSTVAQLKNQYQTGLDSLDQQLNQQNLTYSGYRIKQEQQAARNYQNALAQAAAGINGNIGQVNANLDAALSSNQQAEIQAANDAANRAWQLALQNLLAGTGSGGGGGGTGGDGSGAGSPSAGATQTPGSYNQHSTYGADALYNTPGSPLAIARAAAGKGPVLF